MAGGANVLSIEALGEFKASIVRFRADAEAALLRAEQEILRTMDWLQIRLTYWRGQVRRCEEAVMAAQRTLDRCADSGDSDHPPDCRNFQMAVLEAKRNLAAAQAELQTVQQWGRMMQQGAEEYRQQAQRFKQELQVEMSRASAYVEGAIATLLSYASIAPPSGASLPPLSQDPSIQALAGIPGEAASQVGGIFGDAIDQIFGGGHPEAGSSREREPSPESVEGGPGGVERG